LRLRNKKRLNFKLNYKNKRWKIIKIEERKKEKILLKNQK
jgi:hypothetical protein